jgi:hypothetical protein
MSRIRYWYDEARDGGEKYSAEEWIVDDMALNKSKTKLAPICGKFRRETIDLKDTLFKSIQDTLGNKVLNNSQIAVAPAPGVTATPISNATTIVTATPVTPPAQPAIIGGSEGNTEIKVANNVTPSKEQSIDDQIKASSRMTITAGNDEQFEIGKECWGGFGQLFGKEVAFCVIDQAKSMGNMLMDQSDNYKMEEILKQIALENRTTVGSVKKEIEFAIHEAMNNSQTDSKNFWNELSYDGKEPSVETVIAALVSQVICKINSLNPIVFFVFIIF